MASTRSNLLSSITTALVMGGIFVSWQAFADRNAATDNVPRLIPYHGTLEFNGQPVNATGDDAPWMRFEVYDGNGANAPLLYEQDLRVEVYSGQFTTALGPTGANNTSLEGVVAYADDLYLKLTLLNDPDDDTDDIALANAQRLLVSPFALWATRSADFDVANDLEVARDVGIGRNLNVTGNTDLLGPMRLSNSLTITGNISNSNGDVTVSDNLALSQNLVLFGDVFDNNSDVTINDGLIVVGGISDSNSDLTINDGLLLNGTLGITGGISDSDSNVTVNDSLDVTGNVTMQGTDLAITNTARGGGGRALVQDASDTLVLNYNNDFAGDTRIDSDVRIAGRLTTGGNTTIGYLKHNDCTWRNVNPYDLSNSTRHEVSCNDGEFMIGWGCYASDRLDGECRIRCCRP